MRVRWRSLALISGVTLSSGLHAQALDLTDKAYVSAAQTVMAYDLLVGRCHERFSLSEADSTTVAAWVTENEVARIRERTSELEQDPAQRGPFNVVRRMFSLPFTAKGQAACKSAVDATKRDNAQFARNSPQMIAALRARGGVTATAATAGRDSNVQSGRNADPAPTSAPSPTNRAGTAHAAAASTTPTSASMAAIAARIDRFGFDTRVAMGVGGFITTKIFPIVLFRDGVALTEVEGLAFAGGLDAHRRAHPEYWTRWRREGQEYQLDKKGEWKKITFRKTYSTLPAGFRLDGHFTSLSGTGTIAIGGSSSVTAVSEYTFTIDGRVVRGGAVGSTSSEGNASVVTSNVAPSRRGRYEIQGVTLRIRYDDGSQELRILVTDPEDPKSVIWLDGRDYVRR
jgi:hypothetical protein